MSVFIKAITQIHLVPKPNKHFASLLSKGKGIITDGRWNRVLPVWLVDVTHSFLHPHIVQSEQAFYLKLELEKEKHSVQGAVAQIFRVINILYGTIHPFRKDRWVLCDGLVLEFYFRRLVTIPESGDCLRYGIRKCLWPSILRVPDAGPAQYMLMPAQVSWDLCKGASTNDTNTLVETGFC
ncbi:hypothetical protein NC653_003879 [Populus alba x Populus x berolinensis]|uniref:Uncharacterized protein n=1 Tax=Populus alba x Populus x berolinensis TaxID=444605 RepID=A0AAD6RUL9_9ROSI|nr:hypothetical protein NC653_003879 [Populus alba x Populus x berolinensis]